MTTWACLDDDGRVWGTVLAGDLVRVELSGLERPIGADGVHALDAALDAAVALQHAVGGHRIKQIAVGAPGFGYDRLGSASDLPIVIQGTH